MPDVEINPAKASDAPAIKKLLYQLGYNVALDKLTQSLTSPARNDLILTCRINNQIVGTMSLIIFDYLPSLHKTCRITALVIDQSARGQGIGTQCIEFATKYARDNACHELEVTTSLKREQTQKYYKNVGFVKASYRYALRLNSD